MKGFAKRDANILINRDTNILMHTNDTNNIYSIRIIRIISILVSLNILHHFNGRAASCLGLPE